MTGMPTPRDGFYPHQQMTADGAARIAPQVHRFVVTYPMGDEYTYPDKRAALHAIKTGGVFAGVLFMDRRKGLYLDPVTGKPLADQVTR